MPRVTSKGQVTIPRHIRTRLNIDSGDEVSFVLEREKVILKK
ncbi:MAG: AbrB/MazE/SpoVT family DNA-binding domain-containing protein, partial [Deltaproteobacteria bacterium]|nr:AbrB/MazE/SpoVT family DNA-binding domain-containing protein [Deltaproteobacteria bacterium]